MPLYTYVNAYMFRDNVKGIQLAPNQMLMFGPIEVVK